MQVVNNFWDSSGFWDILRQYTENNALYILIIVSWVLFLYEMSKRERWTALTAVLLLFVAVFNPVSYKILVDLTGQYKTYYRFFWIIPCEIIMAFLLYKNVEYIKDLKHQLILVCAICIGFLCLNTSAEEWKLPENSYQISRDILEVAWELKNLREKEGQEKITILADTAICHVIREYDATICFPFGEYHINNINNAEDDLLAVMNMLTDNQNNLNADMITKALNSNNVDYLVININNSVSLSFMQKLQWQIVATTSSYHILQYKKMNPG